MHKVIKPFDFYHDGINPTHYEAGELELPADVASIAIRRGWAEAMSDLPDKQAKKGKK